MLYCYQPDFGMLTTAVDDEDDNVFREVRAQNMTYQSPRTKTDALSPGRLQYLRESSITLPLPSVSVQQAIKDFKREK